jgi:arginine/lysine/ornithine decarboxylase
MPGEIISPEAIAYLQTVVQQGAIISGCSDARLKTVKICNN